MAISLEQYVHNLVRAGLFTADELAAVLNRIDTLTEIVSTASERVSEENQARLDTVLDKLGQIRDHLEPQ